MYNKTTVMNALKNRRMCHTDRGLSGPQCTAATLTDYSWMRAVKKNLTIYTGNNWKLNWILHGLIISQCTSFDSKYWPFHCSSTMLKKKKVQRRCIIKQNTVIFILKKREIWSMKNKNNKNAILGSRQTLTSNLTEASGNNGNLTTLLKYLLKSPLVCVRTKTDAVWGATRTHAHTNQSKRL